MRAISRSDQDSHYSDSNGCNSGRSLSWSDENSHNSRGPYSNSSWDNDSHCGSSVYSYDSWDSDYDSICTKQRVREYMDYDLYASDEESNSTEDPGKGGPLSETT